MNEAQTLQKEVQRALDLMHVLDSALFKGEGPMSVQALLLAHYMSAARLLFVTYEMRQESIPAEISLLMEGAQVFDLVPHPDAPASKNMHPQLALVLKEFLINAHEAFLKIREEVMATRSAFGAL